MMSAARSADAFAGTAPRQTTARPGYRSPAVPTEGRRAAVLETFAFSLLLAPVLLFAAVDRPRAAERFAIGDTLHFSVFNREMSEVVDNRVKGNQNRVIVTARQEASLNLLVEADGFIAHPLLGRFAAASRQSDEVEKDVLAACARFYDRDCIVGISVARRQPIYVSGSVMHPGSYEFTPGLTVLHAIALAGGRSVDAAKSAECGDDRAGQPGYRIIRQTSSGPVVVQASETGELLPGDLVAAPDR